jgi:hypothetical protein
MNDELDTHSQHQPHVPDRSQSAQLAFAQQPFEVLAFVLPCGQVNLPSVGRFKRVLDELFPNGCLFGVFRFGVAQQQHVAEAYLCFAVILRQLEASPFVNARRQPALRPSRKRLFVLFPAKRHELTSLSARWTTAAAIPPRVNLRRAGSRTKNRRAKRSSSPFPAPPFSENSSPIAPPQQTHLSALAGRRIPAPKRACQINPSPREFSPGGTTPHGLSVCEPEALGSCSVASNAH